MAGGQSVTGNNDSSDPLVTELVEQLGSPKFLIRQKAAEQLWHIGPLSRAALERAALDPDHEVAKRATKMLSAFEKGIDSQTPVFIAQLVSFFAESGPEVCAQVIRALLRQDRFQLAFRLLDQISSVDDRRVIYKDAFNLTDQLNRLAKNDRWDEMEAILSHPIVVEFDTPTAVFFRHSLGRLPELTNQWQDRLRQRKSDGLKTDDADWIRLIAGLRIQERFGEAIELLEYVTDVNLRNQVELQILMEQGDWRTISSRMVLPGENLRPGDQKKFLSSWLSKSSSISFVTTDPRFRKDYDN